MPSEHHRRWGGARNRRDRISDELSRAQAENIIEAAQHAVAIGLAFNRHITIHWETAGIADADAGNATSQFLKMASDWIGKRGGRMAWAYVRENGDGKGSHVHILVHIPAGHPVGAMQRRWLKRITGRPYVRETINTKSIGGTLAAAQRGDEHYLLNMRKAVGYVVKGVSPATATALRLEKQEAGGRIIGKRCGTSENIGAAARSRTK